MRKLMVLFLLTVPFSTTVLADDTSGQVQFVTRGGNDSNDGLEWGTAKATIGAACAALPSGNSNCKAGYGTIYVGGGDFTISSTLQIGDFHDPITIILEGSNLECTMTDNTPCIKIGNKGHLIGAANAADSSVEEGAMIQVQSGASVSAVVTNADHGTTHDDHFDLENVLIDGGGTVSTALLWIYGVNGMTTVRNVDINGMASTPDILIQSGSSNNQYINVLGLENIFAGCGNLSGCIPMKIVSGTLSATNITCTSCALVDTSGTGNNLVIDGSAGGTLAAITFTTPYFESGTGQTGDFVTIKDANEVNLIDADFGGGPSVTNCVKISESGTTTGGIQVTGRILYQQCTDLINNSITGVTITSASVPGDFDYEFQGTQGQKYIDSPSAAGGTTVNGNLINPTIKSSTGQRYVCVTNTGQLVSSATACSGT
jgi:hypothetical protein